MKLSALFVSVVWHQLLSLISHVACCHLHLCVNPVEEEGHVSINTRPVPDSAALTPARVSHQPPQKILLSDQRTPAVPLKIQGNVIAHICRTVEDIFLHPCLVWIRFWPGTSPLRPAACLHRSWCLWLDHHKPAGCYTPSCLSATLEPHVIHWRQNLEKKTWIYSHTFSWNKHRHLY